MMNMLVVTDMPLFEGKESDPKKLSEVIGQAVGAGSVCWSNMSDTGTFESEKASAIVDEVLAWIQEHYIARGTYRDVEPGSWYEGETE